MCKRINLFAILLTMVVGFTSMPVSADNITIDTSGATPFMYGDRSYLPLQSVASFLGAQLSWDPVKGQSVMSYQGKDLALTPNNIKALLVGQPVVLTAPPVVVGGRTYVPTETLRKFYNVPVEWDKTKSEVKINGPNGWGTVKVNSRPPWHGGPPPWAPAWGERCKQAGHNYLTPGNQEHRKGEWKQKGKSKGK